MVKDIALNDKLMKDAASKRKRRKPPARRKKKGGEDFTNPTFPDTEAGRREKRELMDSIGFARECVEDYFPEEYGKQIPAAGAWIMLLMSVHVGKEIAPGVAEPVTLPHLSIWFATPALLTCGERYGFRPAVAVVQTPQGEVRVFPHEYTIVKDLSAYLGMTEEEGFYIHFMREEGGFDVDRLFYLMSRGIPKGEAQRLLLPELTDPFFCYFTFHPAYSDAFGEGFGTPYLTTANHERRAAARRERTAQ